MCAASSVTRVIQDGTLSLMEVKHCKASMGLAAIFSASILPYFYPPLVFLSIRYLEFGLVRVGSPEGRDRGKRPRHNKVLDRVYIGVYFKEFAVGR